MVAMAGSFWEKMGRSVGDGLQKARDIGASIGEKGEAILDKQDWRRRLRKAREELGRVVDKELRGMGDPPYKLEDPAVKELLAEIKLAESELEKLELASEEKEEEAPGEDVQEQAGERGSAAEPGDDILENPDN
jgi:hypothetical protein